MSDPFGDADSFLSSGSNVAAKWPKVDFEFEGTITGWDGPQQQTDMETGEALYWQGGAKIKESEVTNPKVVQPVMQLLVHVQGPATGITWETNQYIEKPVPDDDGMRTMYVHGELQKALKKAMRDAGGAKMEKGARVWVARRKPVKKANGFWAYTYEARWTPAADNPDAATAALDAAGDPPFEDVGEPPF